MKRFCIFAKLYFKLTAYFLTVSSEYDYYQAKNSLMSLFRSNCKYYLHVSIKSGYERNS